MSLLVQKKESSQVFDFDIAVRPGEHVSWGGGLSWYRQKEIHEYLPELNQIFLAPQYGHTIR